MIKIITDDGFILNPIRITIFIYLILKQNGSNKKKR